MNQKLLEQSPGVQITDYDREPSYLHKSIDSWGMDQNNAEYETWMGHLASFLL